MSKVLRIILTLVILAASAGCRSEKDKGQYKDLDRPRSGDKDR